MVCSWQVFVDPDEQCDRKAATHCCPTQRCRIEPSQRALSAELARGRVPGSALRLIKEITRIRLRHPCRAIWIVMQALLVTLQVIRIDLHK